MRGVEISVGFIITIVIAIVFLSLILSWLQGTFGDISGLSEDLTQQATSTLRDAFRGGEASAFAVWPTRYELSRGEGFQTNVAIQNIDPTGRSPLYFKINVLPVNTNTNTWVTFDSTVTPININTEAFKLLAIEVPDSAAAGTYFFNIVACWSTTTSMGTCTLQSTNIWGTVQQMVITVTQT